MVSARSTWNKLYNKGKGEQMALSRQYFVFRGIINKQHIFTLTLLLLRTNQVWISRYLWR